MALDDDRHDDGSETSSDHSDAPLPTVSASVTDAVHALADAVLAASDAVSSPLLWWVFLDDTPDLPSSVVARLSLGDPMPCDVELEALRGLSAPVEAVGVALSLTSAASFAPDTTTTTERPVEVRFAEVLLRDGTAAAVLSCDEGPPEAPVASRGRVEVYLRRSLGLPSLVDAPEPRVLAARCWLWALLVRWSERPLVSVSREVGSSAPTFEGLSPALAVVAGAAASGESWASILERLRDVSARPSADPADPRLPGAPYAPMVELLGWMDAELFGAEIDATVPSFDELELRWSELVDAPCSFDEVLSTAVDAVGL